MFCKTCGYSMANHYSVWWNTGLVYPYYSCRNKANKYNACPDLPTVRTDRVSQFVWEDCCRVFERLEMIRDTLVYNIGQSLQNLLEDTTGRLHIDQLHEKIEFALKERDNHAQGSYYYDLISGDIREKEAMLQRYEEEWQQSVTIVKLSNIYQQSTLGFLNFLTSMKGRYHETTFADKRNAFKVLGVKVYIHPSTVDLSGAIQPDAGQEWFLVSEASRLTHIAPTTLRHHIKRGNLATEIRTNHLMVIGKDELARYLAENGMQADLEPYQKEWFSINHISWNRIADNHALLRAIRRFRTGTFTGTS